MVKKEVCKQIYSQVICTDFTTLTGKHTDFTPLTGKHTDVTPLTGKRTDFTPLTGKHTDFTPLTGKHTFLLNVKCPPQANQALNTLKNI